MIGVLYPLQNVICAPFGTSFYWSLLYPVSCTPCFAVFKLTGQLSCTLILQFSDAASTRLPSPFPPPFPPPSPLPDLGLRGFERFWVGFERFWDGFEEFSASDLVYIGFEVIYIGFEVVYIGFEAVSMKNRKKVPSRAPRTFKVLS